MAPPKKPWFRMYCETFYDPKIRRLKPDQRWVWAAVLAGARQSPRPGLLLLSEDEPMTITDIAELAGVTPAVARTALKAMERLGMVNDNGPGAYWSVPKWNDRQFESDDSTPRARKSRDATAMQRPINGDATHQKQKTEAESETEGCNSQQQHQDPPDDRRAAALEYHVKQAAAEGRTTTPGALRGHIERTQGSELARWLEEHPFSSGVDAAVAVLGSTPPPKPTLRAVPNVDPAYKPLLGPPKPPISQEEHIARVRARAAAGDVEAQGELANWEKREARKSFLNPASGGA